MTKIAIPLTNNLLSEHFGHCETFAVYELDASGALVNEERLTPPPHEPGVFPAWLKSLGVERVIAGGMGRRALDLFAQNGIEVNSGATEAQPEALIEAFRKNALSNEKPSCNHNHDEGEHNCG